VKSGQVGTQVLVLGGSPTAVINKKEWVGRKKIGKKQRAVGNGGYSSGIALMACIRIIEQEQRRPVHRSRSHLSGEEMLCGG